MDISAIIRKVQHSTDIDKVSVVTRVFDEMQNIYPSEAQILQIVEKTVCDNINGSANLVPFFLNDADFEKTNKFLAGLGLGLAQAGSGLFYLSWSKKLVEENQDFFKRIINELHDAGRQGFLYEVFEIFKLVYPEMEFQLHFGDSIRATKNAVELKKNVYCIFDETIYLLAKENK